MSDSFTFDGTDMATLGLIVVDPKIGEMGRVIGKEHSPVNGEPEFSTQRIDKRIVSLTCSVLGASQQDLQDKLDAIKSIINPVKPTKIMTIDFDPGRVYRARVRSISTPTVLGRWMSKIVIVMNTRSFKEGLAEVTGSSAIATDPDTWATALVDGTNSRTPVVVYYRNSTGSEITNGTIDHTNITAAEALVWQGTIPDGYWLRIGSFDSDNRFIASLGVSSASGADPTALNYIDVRSGFVSGDWPTLVTGTINAFSVAGIATGTVEFGYTARYI